MLEEMGYAPEQMGVTIFYPAGDQELEKASYLVARDLQKMGIDAGVSEVPGNDLEAKRLTSIAAGVEVIVLSR
jgi:hypothetical protein